MLAEVKRWGNSYAIRLTSRDLRRIGVQLGQRVEVEVQPVRTGTADLSALPVFRSGAGDVAERHDDYLYGGR